MEYLDLTLSAAAENLALDEALLAEAEVAERLRETLRVWESPQRIVVVGRSSRLEAEVDREACRQAGVPVLRRVSGGAAIVAGPGCLMYALVLSYARRPELRAVDRAHQVVLETIRAALAPHVDGLARRGICDLAIGPRKVSGNSLRVKRDHLLYHGTILYDFALESIGRLLTMPPRQPGYRQSRPHDTFVANLPMRAEEIRQALRKAWQAEEIRSRWPREMTAQLVQEKYERKEWNEQL
jgi:lipoate---protein ligase